MPARSSPKRRQKTRPTPILSTIWRCSRKACGPARPSVSDRLPRLAPTHVLRRRMLSDLKDFLAELTGGTKPQEKFGETDYRRAAAALLVHIATLDGELDAVKRDKLHTILEAQFALDPAATDALIAEASADDREAVDFYHFTSLLMRTLDEAGRLRIVEMLWEMVYADGNVSEFEANMMWRVSDQIGRAHV